MLPGPARHLLITAAGGLRGSSSALQCGLLTGALSVFQPLRQLRQLSRLRGQPRALQRRQQLGALVSAQPLRQLRQLAQLRLQARLLGAQARRALRHALAPPSAAACDNHVRLCGRAIKVSKGCAFSKGKYTTLCSVNLCGAGHEVDSLNLCNEQAALARTLHMLKNRPEHAYICTTRCGVQDYGPLEPSSC